MSKVKKYFTLMAWAEGQVSKEASAVTRYIGVGSVKVEGINPDKAKLKELFNIETESEPVYTGTQDQNGKQVRYARIDIVLHTVPENNNGIDARSRMSLFIRDQYRYNRDQSKIQVIDKFGRTAWVTKEELSSHTVPTYSNGKKADLDADYRPCFQGEEDITNFFKAFLNIPNPTIYKNNEWVQNTALKAEDCLARFDNLQNVFNGNFSEFVTAWKLQPDNKVKVLYGIKTNDDGKQYQTFYTRMFVRNGQSNYTYLEKDVKSTQEAGALATSEFQVIPLQEYSVDGTSFENNAVADKNAANPFGNPEDNPFFN